MSQKIASALAHKAVSNSDEASAKRRFLFSDPYLGRDEHRYPVNEQGFEAIPGYRIATRMGRASASLQPVSVLTYPHGTKKPGSPERNNQLGSTGEQGLAEGNGSPPTIVPDTQVYPFRANVALLVSIPGTTQPFLATGWFISPYAVITAGHVVHPFGEDGFTGWVSTIEVIPGLNGNNQTPPFGKLTSSRFLCPVGWEQDRDSRVDYAVILLNQGLGSIVGQYGYATYADSDLLASVANLSGYPVVAPDGSLADDRQYYSAGPVENVDDSFVYYSLNTQGGDSGACVYRNIGAQSYAMAIHCSGGDRDRGVRITEPVFQNLQQWASMQG